MVVKGIFVGEKCVECKKEIPVYRKFFCEECFEEMLKEPAIPAVDISIPVVKPAEVVNVELIVLNGVIYQ